MTYFKDKVYLYGSEAITYLNAIFSVVTEPALWVTKLPPPPFTLYGSNSITFTYLEENYSMDKLSYLF